MMFAGAIPLHATAAQRVDDARAGVMGPIAAADVDTMVAARDSQPASPVSLPREMAVRAVYGLAGWLAGATAGYFVGYGLADKTGVVGEDPGLDTALLGAGIGSIVGAAILAAAPRRVANCGFARRLAFAVIGAGVGAGFGQLVYSKDGYMLPFSGVGAGVSTALACRFASAGNSPARP